METIISLDRSIIPACDVDKPRYEEIIKETCDIPQIGGYKISAVLAITEGIEVLVEIARKHTEKPLIYDHQKAGTDIPDTGKSFTSALKRIGINALITKPAQSIAIILPSLLLDWSNFIPRVGNEPPNLNQPFEAFLAIRLFTVLIPGLALLLSALILKFYPIRGEYWDSIQKEILILHDKKHKKLQEMERS